jgi:hypothetical protein
MSHNKFAQFRHAIGRFLLRDALVEEIEVKSNLTITARERGKIVARRKGHNIFLNLGRIWIPDAISYSSLPAGAVPPPTPVTKVDDRGVRFMGLGIGSNLQTDSSAGIAPLSTHYPGTNAQTDAMPEVQRLERPVRLTADNPSSPALPPYAADDVWLGQIQAPAVKPTPTSVRFTRVFSENEVSFGPFTRVPLTEIALFLHSPSSTYVNVYNNTAVAYDTFDPFNKTSAISFQIDWDWRFLWATSTASPRLRGLASLRSLSMARRCSR